MVFFICEINVEKSLFYEPLTLFVFKVKDSSRELGEEKTTIL